MAASAFLYDKRDLEFLMFEHLRVQDLFSLPYFANHSQESVQEMMGALVTFLQQSVGPLNKIGDRVGCTHDASTKQVKTPPGTKEAYLKYVQSGFLTSTDPESMGGLQAPQVAATLFLDLACGANPAFAMYPGLTRSALHVLSHFGDDWMKTFCIPKIVEGLWTGTMCLTEPGAGSAVGDLKTSAKRADDGSYRIKGTKQWISGGENDFTENIMHLVLARIEGASPGMEGVSLFLVPKFKIDPKTGVQGVQNDVFCISLEEKMGIHGNATCLMSFGDKGDCQGFLIGEEHKGISYMFLMMNEARLVVGLQGVATAAVAHLNAENYAKERVQGVALDAKKDDPQTKRVPIIQHPDVKRMLLTQRALVEGGRALVYSISYALDRSTHSPDALEKKQAAKQVDFLTPVLKAWGSDMGFRAITLAMQTYGGYGFTKDYPIEQMMRDAKITSIYEGTNGIQALDFLGRKLRWEEGSAFLEWMGQIGRFCANTEAHPRLQPLCAEVQKHTQSLLAAAQHLGAKAKEGRKAEFVVNAYPYLMAFGHVSVAFLLMQQMAIALQALENAPAEKEARFYRNKVRTASFFVHHILPEAQAYLANVCSPDGSCLEFEF